MTDRIFRKTFLEGEDISEMFSCGKSKAYMIIKNANNELQAQGKIKNYYQGRVLTSGFCELYGIDPEKEIRRLKTEEE